MYSLQRSVSFLGKAEYLEHPVARRLFPMTGMVPLDRTGRRARVTLRRVQEILGDGGVVGVHPEGSRSRDGLLNHGHSGVAQMALQASAPIVPVRAKIEIRYGAPIGMGEWANNRRTREARTGLTEEVMQAIASLSGQQRREHVREAPLR
jgi:1-acyl-sn-glycerol-3-phosphate acyltransferase